MSSRKSPSQRSAIQTAINLGIEFFVAYVQVSEPVLVILPIQRCFCFSLSTWFSYFWSPILLNQIHRENLVLKNCFLLVLDNLALLIYEYYRLTSWKEVVRRYSMRKTFLKNLSKSTTKYMYFIITPNNITSFSKVTG